MRNIGYQPASLYCPIFRVSFIAKCWSWVSTSPGSGRW